MSERVWHKGPPRFIGWWNASINKDKAAWRWWDGAFWSDPAFESYSPSMAGAYADPKTLRKDIEWTDYWPEKARVPRLDPTGGHWTFNVDGAEPENLPERIDFVFRDGEVVAECKSYGLLWHLRGSVADILAWRPAA